MNRTVESKIIFFTIFISSSLQSINCLLYKVSALREAQIGLWNKTFYYVIKFFSKFSSFKLNYVM